MNHAKRGEKCLLTAMLIQNSTDSLLEAGLGALGVDLTYDFYFSVEAKRTVPY